MEPLIELRGVEKAYRGRTVLRIEQLTIHSGERVLIYGRNGSGKSTLLRLLAGISRPESGEIRFAQRLREGPLGYAPQAGGLAGALSLRANLELRRHLFGRGTETSPSIEELGLVPHLATRFSELSSGYQRLAGIAAALAIEPAWLLLDEPFGWLDANNQAALVNALGRVVQSAALEVAALAVPEREDLPFITRYLHVREGRICAES